MAVKQVTVNANGSVVPDSVPAKRETDSVKWNGAPNRHTIHFITPPSPFGGNDFPVPTQELSVLEGATQGKHYYEVRDISGAVMADPDVDVE